MPTRTVIMKQRESKTERGVMLVADSAEITGSSPQVNEVWIDKNEKKLKYYDGAVQEIFTAPVPVINLPTGMIMPYAANTAPSGWLVCDGAEVSQTTYPDLFAVIGSLWGTAGAGNFKVPDLRGMFLRGRNQMSPALGNATGQWSDPEYASRLPMGTGAAGDVASRQDDQFEDHFHSVPRGGTAQSPDQSNLASGNNGYPNGNVNTTAAGGAETRPKNVYVTYCIKT